MNPTFGIAADVVRRKRRAPLLVAVGSCAVFCMLFWLQTKDLVIAFGMATALSVFFGAVVWTSNRQFLAAVGSHSLTLAPDGIVIRDGAAESRLPYSAIKSLIVNRRGSRPVGLVFLRDNGVQERLPPYERLPELIAELRSRVRTATYSERRWIHV